MVTRVALLSVALLVAGCDTGFRPETLVEGLRVLGVRSDPADLRPGEVAQLQSLILDPAMTSGSPSTLWVGCAPDPFNLNRSACSDPAVLQDPASLGTPDGGLPTGVSVIGFNGQAAYVAPADVFSVLPEGDARRVAGTVGQVLAIAVAEQVSPAATNDELRALFDRVKAHEVASLIALYRIRISEDPQRNHNPVFGPLTVGGEAQPAHATLALKPGQRVTLDVAAADDTFETYVTSTPSGGEETKTERLLAAWYSTSGRYSEPRTALRESVKTTFTAPGGADRDDPVPSSRQGSLYVTLRDTRGGQTWAEFAFFVCDEGLPEPQVKQLTWPTNAADPVTLEGEGLDSLLDVLVNGVPLSGRLVSSRWESNGTVPVLPSGSSTVTYSTKRCTTGLAGTVERP